MVTDGDHVEKSINRLLVGGPCREKYQRLLVGTM